jgi:hypothetical protein
VAGPGKNLGIDDKSEEARDVCLLRGRSISAPFHHKHLGNLPGFYWEVLEVSVAPAAHLGGIVPWSNLFHDVVHPLVANAIRTRNAFLPNISGTACGALLCLLGVWQFV